MTARLSASTLFEGCRSARRLGIATGERLGPTAPEQIWPALRDTLGLPSRLDPEQERELFEAFAAAHRSSGVMRAAPAHDNRATQVLSSARMVQPNIAVSWATTEPVPPPPLSAAATLLRSIRHFFRPPPSARETAILEVLSALELEVMRHRSRLYHLGRCLEDARGRR